MKENRSAQNLGFMRREEGSLRLARDGGEISRYQDKEKTKSGF
jgi:hypothetical protein